MISAFIKEMFKVGMYKPAQGKAARRATFLGLAIVFIAGAWAAYRDNLLNDPKSTAIFALMTVVVGLWISYRTINLPVFADFLVSVEAEMRKVSWPSKKELFTTTKVVMVFMVLFVLLIYFYDTVFSLLFTAMNIIMGA